MSDIMKKLSGVMNVLLTVLLIAAVGILVFVTACTVQGKPVMFNSKCIMQIVTGSMEPTLHVDDCVVVQQVSPESLRKGDIIAYVAESGQIAGLTVMHRITECLPDGSFIVRGDANPIEDALPVRPDQIQGKFIRKTRFFTWLTSFADFRKVLLLAVMCMTSGMSFYEVRTVMQIGREIKEESKEERRERLIREAIDREKEKLAQQNYQPDAKERENQ